MPTPSGPGLSARQLSDDVQPRLVVSIVPLVVLGLLCIAGLARNAYEAWTAQPRGASLNAKEARLIARETCAHISNEPASVVETCEVEYYSVKTRSPDSMWEVECLTGGDSYLIRMQSSTGRVFSVMQIASDAAETVEDGVVSHAQAERRARAYLSVLSLSSQKLRQIDRYNTYHAAGDRRPWIFMYRSFRGSGRKNLVSVSINKTTGALVNAWSPPYTL